MPEINEQLSLDEAIELINAAIEQGDKNAAQHDHWERRYRELFPQGLTQEQIDEANAMMWKRGGAA